MVAVRLHMPCLVLYHICPSCAGRRDVLLLLAFLCFEQHVLVTGIYFMWPGLRDGSNTLGRGKRGSGQEECSEPVPFGVRKLEIVVCIQLFFSQFSAFLAPFLSNYSLFWTSDQIAPGRTISQHFQLGLVGILIPYDHFV